MIHLLPHWLHLVLAKLIHVAKSLNEATVDCLILSQKGRSDQSHEGNIVVGNVVVVEVVVQEGGGLVAPLHGFNKGLHLNTKNEIFQTQNKINIDFKVLTASQKSLVVSSGNPKVKSLAFQDLMRPVNLETAKVLSNKLLFSYLFNKASSSEHFSKRAVRTAR